MSGQERSGKLQDLLRLVSFALLVVAVVKELRTPAAERTWHGQIGIVPYDLRPPTFTRVRDRLWNPDNPHVLVPQPFGVGWSVNVGRVWRLLTDR
jgi:hypothetical protein